MEYYHQMKFECQKVVRCCFHNNWRLIFVIKASQRGDCAIGGLFYLVNNLRSFIFTIFKMAEILDICARMAVAAIPSR